MGKKTKSNQVAETTPVAPAKTKVVEQTPKEVQQKHAKQASPKETKQVVQENKAEKNQKVQVFGLYFHSQKVLNTFLFFAIGIIVAPICTYLFAFNYLEAVPEITRNQAQMYSGFVSVGVVILFMIGYCVVAITDETNFQHEQKEYELLTEKEKKEISKEKLTEAFEETALEYGYKEVVRKQPKGEKKPVEAAPAPQESKKKTEAKAEVKNEEPKTQKKEETKSTKKEEPKTQKKEEPKTTKKEEPKTQKKEETKSQKKEEVKKEEPKKGAEKQQTPAPVPTATATQTATKGKETKGKKDGKKETTTTNKNQGKQAATNTTTPTPAPVPTKKQVAQDDDWNYVKESKKKTTTEEVEEVQSKKESVTTYESNDTFIVVKTNKKNV